MDSGIMKLVFSSIIFFASLIGLTAICTESKFKSKLFNSIGGPFVHILIAVCLGMIVLYSMLSVFYFMFEIGLEANDISTILIFVAGVLTFLLVGYFVLKKVRLNEKLKERCRISDKSREIKIIII